MAFMPLQDGIRRIINGKDKKAKDMNQPHPKDYILSRDEAKTQYPGMILCGIVEQQVPPTGAR